MISSRRIVFAFSRPQANGGWFRAKPIFVSGGAFEAALLDTHTSWAEVAAVA
jgi:hypothetical protein